MMSLIVKKLTSTIKNGKAVAMMLFAFALCMPTSAQVTFVPRQISEKIVIDANLDEKVWKETPPFTTFVSYRPDFGKRLKDSTYAWIVYDNENLYIAFRCIDSDPAGIKASIAARDQIIDDDWVCVNLDSRNERLGTNAFVVNPAGIQYDAWSTATSEDVSIDLVWYSAGKITDRGYNVEMKIPFKSLRFSTGDSVNMGVLFERRNARTLTHVTYPALDPSKGNAYLTQLLSIKMAGIKHKNLFEVLPSVTYTFHQQSDGSSLKTDKNKPDVGCSFKYGFSSSMILDATINPDFSQVEADAGQVDINLRSRLFLREKRLFFMEGSDKFNIAAVQSTVIDPLWYLVYTRNIDNPVAGIKLSGKTDEHNSIAILYAADRAGKEPGDGMQYAHYPVFRYKYNYGSDNFLGLLYTGYYNSIISNNVAGFDGQFRFNKSTMVEFNHIRTVTKDSILTHGSSSGITLSRTKRGLDLVVAFKDIGKNFTSYTGYYTRTGITQGSVLLQPKLYPDSSAIRRIDLELFGSYTWDRIWSMGETMNDVAVTMLVGKAIQFKLKKSFSNEIYLGSRFNTGGVHALFTGRAGKWFTGSILYRHINSIYYSSTPFAGTSNIVRLNLSIIPVRHLNLAYDYNYSDFTAKGSSSPLYNYQIDRFSITFQANKYLFFRYIGEYNSYWKTFQSDGLISFTYIPGTVFQLGYSSLFQQQNEGEPFFGGRLKPDMTVQGFFAKISYLFRK